MVIAPSTNAGLLETAPASRGVVTAGGRPTYLAAGVGGVTTPPAAQTPSPVATQAQQPTTKTPVANQPEQPSLLATPKTAEVAPVAKTTDPALRETESPQVFSPTTVRNRDRADTRGPRDAQEARPKDTYYRKEYGWIMSDADVAKEKEIESNFNTAVGEAEGQIASGDEEFNSLVSDGERQINSAFDTSIRSIVNPTANMVPVKVYTEGNLEQTYMVPRDVAEQLRTQSFNGEEGHYASDWHEDNNALYVYTRPVGAPHAYGKELHESLADVVGQVNNARTLYDQAVANANKERDAAIARLRAESLSAYNPQREGWQASLDYERGGYSRRVQGGRTQYEDSKKKLNDSLQGIDEGLLENPTNQVQGKK